MENVENNLRWTLISNIVNLFSGLIIILLISRLLGPEIYGQYETLIAIVAVSVLILDLGLSPASARMLAKYKHVNNYLQEILLISMLIKVIIILSFIFVMLLNINFIDSLIVSIDFNELIILIILIFLMRTVYEFISRSLQGLNEVSTVAKANLLKTSFHLVALIGVYYFNNFNLYSVLFIEVISFIFINIFMGLKLYEYKESLVSLKSDKLKFILIELLQTSLPLFIISIGFMLFNQSDVLLLQHYFSSKIVALFAITLIIITKVQAPFTAIGFTFAPLFTNASQEIKMELFQKILTKVLVLNLPLVMITFFLAPDIILVFFGDEYKGSILILKAMSVFLFFLSLNTVFTPIMDFLGYAKIRATILIIAAAMKVFLSIYLLNFIDFWGIIVSTIISYTVYSILIQFYLIHKINNLRKPFFLKDFKIILYKLVLSLSISSLLIILIGANTEISLTALLIKISLSIGIYLLFIKKLMSITLFNIMKFQ